MPIAFLVFYCDEPNRQWHRLDLVSFIAIPSRSSWAELWASLRMALEFYSKKKTCYVLLFLFT